MKEVSDQTHVKNLAESFKTITEKLEEVHKSTKNLGRIFEKSDPKNETPTHLAIERTNPASQNARVNHIQAFQMILQ